MYRRARRIIVSPRYLGGLALAIGLAGTAMAIFRPTPYTKVFPPLISVGALLALFLRNRDARTEHLSLPGAALASLYFLLLASTAALYASANYRRTFPIHVLVLCLYVLSMMGVFTFRSTTSRLSLILGTGVFHRGLVYYSSATQLGIDSLFHNRMASQIAARGTIDPLAAAASKYWYAPLYHVFTGISTRILDIPVRDAAFLSVTIVAVLIPVLVIFTLLDQTWNGQIAAGGGLLYLIADYAIASSVHTGSTTIGIVFFTLALLSGIRYLDTRQTGYLVVFLSIVLFQTFTHQMSMVVTAVGVWAYTSTRSIWTGMIGRREIALGVSTAMALAYQWSVTKYNGPQGEHTFFEVLVGSLGNQLTSDSSQQVLPVLDSATLAGAEALSAIHFAGAGILFCLAVFGAIYWIHRKRGSDQQMAICLGFTVVGMTAVIFGGTVLGVDSLIPNRWTSFLYVLLALLAAPAVGVIATTAVETGNRKRSSLVLAVVILAVVAPYTALMTWNYPGAIDGPVFDDAPGAQRLSSTPTEAGMYDHVVRYGGSNPVVADRLANRMLVRHYEYPAAIFETRHGEQGAELQDGSLLVDRAYAETDHASYYLEFRDSTFVVYGPIPVEWNEHSVVYSSGSDRLVYYQETPPDSANS